MNNIPELETPVGVAGNRVQKHNPYATNKEDVVGKLVIKGVGLLLLATLSAIGLQSPSYASSTPGTRTIQLTRESVGGDQFLVGYLDSDWHLGDCTLSFGSKVQLNLTRGWLIWDGAGRTSKTRNGDIWHSTFHFQSFRGTELTVGELDSTKMTIINHDYRWSVAKVGLVGLSASLPISQVVWDSAC